MFAVNGLRQIEPQNVAASRCPNGYTSYRQMGPMSGKIYGPTENGPQTKKPSDLLGFNESGRSDLNTRPLRPESSVLPG